MDIPFSTLVIYGFLVFLLFRVICWLFGGTPKPPAAPDSDITRDLSDDYKSISEFVHDND